MLSAWTVNSNFFSKLVKAHKRQVKQYFPLGLLLQTYCKPTGMSTNPFMLKIIRSFALKFAREEI